MFNECQIRRTVPFQHQAVGKMQALSTSDTARGGNPHRRETHRRIRSNQTEPLQATVPMVEALQVQALLFGVGLEAQPLAAAGAQVLRKCSANRP